MSHKSRILPELLYISIIMYIYPFFIYIYCMRAAIIGSSNLDLNGMAEKNVIQMAEILSNQGYDVTIFTLPDNNKNIILNGKFTVNSNIFKMDLFARKTFIRLTDGRSAGLIGLFSFDLFSRELMNYDLYYFPCCNPQ